MGMNKNIIAHLFSFKLDKKHVLVHLAQCSSCRFANKNMQKLFWDGFSSYKKGGKPAEKKEEKKKFG